MHRLSTYTKIRHVNSVYKLFVRSWWLSGEPFCFQAANAGHLLGLGGLLGQEHCLDVGEDSTLGDGHS